MTEHIPRQKNEVSDESEGVPLALNTVKKRQSRFLLLKEAYNYIIEEKSLILNKISVGDKSDCSMLISSQECAKDINGKIRYFDDCGIYSGHRCHKFYLLKPELSHIYCKNGNWFSDIHHKNAVQICDKELVSEIVVLTAALKSNPNFKRKITRIVGIEKILIEYIGKFLVNSFNLFIEFQPAGCRLKVESKADFLSFFNPKIVLNNKS